VKTNKLTVFLALFLLVALLTGCTRDARNTQSLETVALKTSPDGIRYKLVKIEGRTFVATQSAYFYWTLAGPID
jgi:hypothetical protein